MTDDEGDQRADKSRHRAVSSATLNVTIDRTGTQIPGGSDLFRPGGMEHAPCYPVPARALTNHWRPRHIGPFRAPDAAHARVLASRRCASAMLDSQALLCRLPRAGDRSRHKSRRASCALCSDGTDGVPLCCRQSSGNHRVRSFAISATANVRRSSSRKDLRHPAVIWPSLLPAGRPGVDVCGSGRLQ